MNLGDKVRFQKELVRKNHSCTNSSLTLREANELNKVGKLTDDYTRYGIRDNKKILEGFVCGIRTIKYKGFSNWIGYEEGYGFATIEHKKVYLVACDLKEMHRVPEEYFISE